MRKIIINTPEQDLPTVTVQEQPIVDADPTPATTKTSEKKEVPVDETTSS
jgi:hypothetical protein